MSSVISIVLLLGLAVVTFFEVKSLVGAIKERKRVKREGGKVDEEVDEEDDTTSNG